MIKEQLYQDYLKALLAGDRAACHDTVQGLLETKIDIKVLYHALFQRSLYEVGTLWENNRITVANEHLATAVTESLLNLVYPSIFSTERIGKKAIISCSANEYHQIGGKMVADLFELHGWEGHFLGANAPPEDMVRLVQDTKPDVVGLSLSILSNIENLKHAIEVLKTDFPKLDLLIGGQAFTRGGLDTIKRYSGTEYIPSLEALENMLK